MSLGRGTAELSLDYQAAWAKMEMGLGKKESLHTWTKTQGPKGVKRVLL